MNSGKSTALLQANYNYTSEEKHTILISQKIDDRFGDSVIASRLGFKANCFAIDQNTNVFDYLSIKIKEGIDHNANISCIFIDEAQFMTKEQIIQLSDIVDDFNIPIMAYGLKNNFKGELFEGSAYLLSYADEIRSLKQACFCGKAASMILRYDESGNIVRSGGEVAIGSESMYRSVCRKHWKEGNLGDTIYKKLNKKNPF